MAVGSSDPAEVQIRLLTSTHNPTIKRGLLRQSPFLSKKILVIYLIDKKALNKDSHSTLRTNMGCNASRCHVRAEQFLGEHMSRWTRGLEIATNIAVLAVCCLVGTLLIRNYFFPKAQPSSKALVLGSRVDLPNAQWSKANQTVVLAISTECHFCSESAPFYQKLTKAALDKHDRVVAVLPQEISVARAYLDAKQVTVDDVLQMPLNRLGVDGTPTLLLVNSKGQITATWIGKLTPKTEVEVINTL
jgi:hypothetical protein